MIRKTIILSAFFCLLLAALQASAQESIQSQIDFVRKLRDKGYSDLALEYLEKLQKNAPPALADKLFLETARTRVGLARRLKAEERMVQINKARAELQDFLKRKKGSPEANTIRLELARLSTFLGQTMLSRALREPDIDAQQQEAFKAEKQFDKATAELEAAAKLVKDDAERREVLFDQAINLMEKSRCYVATGRDELNRKKVLTIVEARKIFEKIAEADKTGLGSLARAWLVKCYQVGQEYNQANKSFRDVMDYIGADGQPGKRWARYFRIQGIPTDPNLKMTPVQRWKTIEKEARDWLKDYPQSHTTPEGYGVRYELGFALYQQAALQKKQDADATLATYKESQEVLTSLAKSDNDFAEKANQLNISISLKRIGGSDVPIARLTNFEDCFLRAQVELTKVKKTSQDLADAKDKAKIDKLKEQRKEEFRSAIYALRRSLALADNSTLPSRRDEAWYNLLLSYMLSGDPYRTAVTGEYLGRMDPPGKRSAVAAGYALEAYANLSRANSPIALQKMRDLAEYILSPERQKYWASEPVTAVTRFQIAMLYNREGKFKQAIEQLQTLPKDFSGYIFARSQMVFIAMKARDTSQDPKEKAAYQDLVRKTINELPKLPAEADGSTATMYFFAKLEEAKYLYADGARLLNQGKVPQASKQYAEMAKYLAGIDAEFKKAGRILDPQSTEKIDFFLDTMGKYSRLGQADAEYRQGNYDKVLSANLAGAVVSEIAKQAQKAKVVRRADFEVIGEILGLALRANVQKGNVKEGRQILGLLEKLKGQEDNLLADTAPVLRNLVVELEAQVRNLQRKGDKALLKKTVANFSEFLDALVAQAEKSKLSKNDMFFLAKCYDSLDKHERAASLFAKYPEPPFLNKELKDQEKFSPEEEKELQTYWYVQVKEASMLRLAGKLEEANKILQTLKNHKHARQQIMAEKESVHLLEDKGLYGRAITDWGKFMSDPAVKRGVANDPKLKEIYFDAYYHYTYCWYKYSQLDDVKSRGKSDDYLARAAGYIVRLETSPNREGWDIVGFRFRDLIDREAALKKEYEKQKGS